MSAIVTIQTRSGTAAQWTAANPILAVGEQGIETDTRKVKYGDGTTAWNSLAYASYTLPIATTTTLGGVISDGNTINIDGTGVISTVSVAKVKQLVKNATGFPLYKGQAVYVNGANGTNVTVALAQANAELTSSKTLGLLEADIANGGTGYVVTDGILGTLNTNAAANEGDPVWLSPTVAGGLVYGIANKPLAPYHLVYMGVVSRKNANNGEIFIKVQNGFELYELHDVAISSPANWNVLRYDSVTSLWKNDVLPASGTVTSVAALTLGTTGTDVSSTVANSTSTPVITLNIPTASSTNRGALSPTDWTTFNSKLSSLPTASTTVLGGVKVDGTTIVIDGSGVISSYQTYTLPTASTTVLGGVKVDGTSITINGAGVISGASTYTLPTASTSVLGGVKIDGTSIVINGSGVISAAGATGTVTTVAIVNANGFNGTVANPNTAPNITLSTTVTGLIKGNGTAISAATVGTDYSVGTSALETGILKSTTATGALSIAVAADFPTLNQNTTGYASALKSASTTVSVSAATAPTTGQVLTAVDGSTATWQTPSGGGYTLPTASTTVLGGVKVDGSTITINGSGVISAAGGGGSGTVTSVSVVSANGFTGTVANAATTPEITLTTSITGILKGNGTAISAAVAGDFPTLNQNTTGTAANVTGTVAIANGGTGATTLAGANLPVTNVANTFTGTQTFSGTSTTLAAILTNAAETTTVSATAATGTIAYYTSSQSVLYYTSNASANWTINIRHSAGTTLNTAMAVGQTITVTHMVTNGATAFYNSVVQVDGTVTGITTKWQGSTAPTTGNANAVDVYTYAIIKTGVATFSVFVALSKFA